MEVLERGGTIMQETLFKGFKILLLIIVVSVGFFWNRDGFNEKDRSVDTVYRPGVPEVSISSAPAPQKKTARLPEKLRAEKKSDPFKAGELWDPGFIQVGQVWAMGGEKRVVIFVSQEKKRVSTVELHILKRRNWSVSESAGWADNYALNTTNYGDWKYVKTLDLKP